MPIQTEDYDEQGKVFEVEYFSGLTKREHFAGLAMQGMLSNTEITNPNKIILAEMACAIADELLAELDKVTL